MMYKVVATHVFTFHNCVLGYATTHSQALMLLNLFMGHPKYRNIRVEEERDN